MYRNLFTPTELIVAVGLIALAGFAALALGHGNFQTSIIVEIAMVAGFTSILRTRDAEANGRPSMGWQRWSAVMWFGFAAMVLLVAPSL